MAPMITEAFISLIGIKTAIHKKKEIFSLKLKCKHFCI